MECVATDGSPWMLGNHRLSCYSFAIQCILLYFGVVGILHYRWHCWQSYFYSDSRVTLLVLKSYAMCSRVWPLWYAWRWDNRYTLTHINKSRLLNFLVHFSGNKNSKKFRKYNKFYSSKCFFLSKAFQSTTIFYCI
jgi:hypothetical protein